MGLEQATDLDETLHWRIVLSSPRAHRFARLQPDAMTAISRVRISPSSSSLRPSAHRVRSMAATAAAAVPELLERSLEEGVML